MQKLIKQTKYKKIENFTDLVVWQEGHQLVLEVYKVTKNFPKTEKYALIDQLRRCAVSITSNIAEGFSRQGKKEKIQFYYTVKGSLTELHNQLLIAKDVGYIDKDKFDELLSRITIVSKLLTGLIRSARNKK